MKACLIIDNEGVFRVFRRIDEVLVFLGFIFWLFFILKGFLYLIDLYGISNTN